MKTFLFKSILYSALATFTLTACNNDETEWQPNSPTQEETEAGVPAGHFRATFFPSRRKPGETRVPWFREVLNRFNRSFASFTKSRRTEHIVIIRNNQ